MPNDHIPAERRGPLTRRAVLAALPAVGLVPGAALAFPPASTDTPILRLPPDPHRGWIAERHRAVAHWSALEEETEEWLEAQDAWHELDTRIYRTPAATPDGMIAQLEFAIEEDEPFLDDEIMALLKNLFASLRAMA